MQDEPTAFKITACKLHKILVTKGPIFVHNMLLRTVSILKADSITYHREDVEN
jgi:hypothetical protein